MRCSAGVPTRAISGVLTRAISQFSSTTNTRGWLTPESAGEDTLATTAALSLHPSSFIPYLPVACILPTAYCPLRPAQVMRCSAGVPTRAISGVLTRAISQFSSTTNTRGWLTPESAGEDTRATTPRLQPSSFIPYLPVACILPTADCPLRPAQVMRCSAGVPTRAISGVLTRAISQFSSTTNTRGWLTPESGGEDTRATTPRLKPSTFILQPLPAGCLLTAHCLPPILPLRRS